MGRLKPQSNGPLHSNRPTVIGTLAVDGWTVTFGIARRGLDGLRAVPNVTAAATYSMWHYKYTFASLHSKGLSEDRMVKSF